MSSLTELLLDCNEITSLPLSVGRLTELQVSRCLLPFDIRMAPLLLPRESKMRDIWSVRNPPRMP